MGLDTKHAVCNSMGELGADIGNSRTLIANASHLHGPCMAQLADTPKHQGGRQWWPHSLGNMWPNAKPEYCTELDTAKSAMPKNGQRHVEGPEDHQ